VFGFLKRSAAPVQVVEPPMTRSAAAAPKTRRGAGAHVQRMMFAGAETDRLTADWPSFPLPADDIIRRNQRILVARSREQAANNDYGKAFIRMAKQNIVGPMGIRLQAQARDQNGALDADANDAIEAAFSEWCLRQNCDVTGKSSFRSLQSASVGSAGVNGEFMFRKIFGADAGPLGFALQMLDPQRCPVDYDVERTNDGTFTRHGIEFNRFGRPLNYLFTTTDERDANYNYNGRAFVRVPAAEIIHGFLPEMVGQKRGLPWMATGLWRMRMLHGYENSALVNARASASKGGFFAWEEGFGPESAEGEEREDITMELEPGTWQELPAGVKPVAAHPPYPQGEFAMFRKEHLRAMASGFGVAYNNLANDLEGVNFSSIRQGAIDEREHWKELQEWLIETLIAPAFLEWLPRALLMGLIVTKRGGTLRPERLDKYREVQWQARRWAWIDPKSDVQSAIDMKNNLMGSFGQFIRDQGKDPQTVWREIAEDINQMRLANIPEEYILQAMGQKLNPVPAAGADARGNTAPPD